MAYFKVSSQVLRSKANELENLNAQFKSRIEDLKGSERALSASYEAESQKVFHAAFEANCTKFMEFYKGINNYAQALKAEADRYEKAEARNIQIAKN